jgi:hypothetical protein
MMCVMNRAKASDDSNYWLHTFIVILSSALVNSIFVQAAKRKSDTVGSCLASLARFSGPA